MKDLTNPAKRILNIVDQVKNKPDNLRMSEVWGGVFGIDAQLVKQDPHQVYEKLRFLRDELDALEEFMEETKFSDSLYKPYIERVRYTIDASSPSSGWSNYKNYLK
jgi:hypothetical protein